MPVARSLPRPGGRRFDASGLRKDETGARSSVDQNHQERLRDLIRPCSGTYGMGYKIHKAVQPLFAGFGLQNQDTLVDLSSYMVDR